MKITKSILTAAIRAIKAFPYDEEGSPEEMQRELQRFAEDDHEEVKISPNSYIEPRGPGWGGKIH